MLPAEGAAKVGTPTLLLGKQKQHTLSQEVTERLYCAPGQLAQSTRLHQLSPICPPHRRLLSLSPTCPIREAPPARAVVPFMTQ